MPYPAVPDRLRELVEQDRRRPLVQRAVAVDPDPWCARLGVYASVLQELPDRLDRDVLRRLAADRVDDERDTIAVFVATQIWGYGDTGYGPYRLGEALSAPELGNALTSAREWLRARRPLDAFETLCVEHRVRWVGTSFGSKFLHFAESDGGALILDSVVAGWIASHAGVRWRLARNTSEYRAWLSIAAAWSSELGVAPERLELLIFTDGLAQDSSWRADAV